MPTGRILKIVASVVTVLLCITLLVTVAHGSLGPEFHPFKYNANPPGTTVTYEGWAEGHRFYEVHYDTNRDAKPDVACHHAAKGEGNFELWPLFLEVDKDLDGIPDATYIDLKGEGRYADIRLYVDLTVPHHHSPTGGLVPKEPYGGGEA